MHGRSCSRTIEARWFWPGHGPETLQIGTGQRSPVPSLLQRSTPPRRTSGYQSNVWRKTCSGRPVSYKELLPATRAAHPISTSPGAIWNGVRFASCSTPYATNDASAKTTAAETRSTIGLRHSPRDKQKAKGNLRGGRQRRSPRPFFALAPAEARAAKDTKCGLVTSRRPQTNGAGPQMALRSGVFCPIRNYFFSIFAGIEAVEPLALGVSCNRDLLF